MLSCVFTSRSWKTRCALVTGVKTCALPISNGCGLRPIVLWPFFRVQRLGGGCGQKACAESRVEKVFRFFRADRRRAGYQNNLLVLRKLLNFAGRQQRPWRLGPCDHDMAETW